MLGVLQLLFFLKLQQKIIDVRILLILLIFIFFLVFLMLIFHFFLFFVKKYLEVIDDVLQMKLRYIAGSYHLKEWLNRLKQVKGIRADLV